MLLLVLLIMILTLLHTASPAPDCDVFGSPKAMRPLLLVPLPFPLLLMPPLPTNILLRAAGGTVALSATGEYASATSASASTSNAIGVGSPRSTGYEMTAESTAYSTGSTDLTGSSVIHSFPTNPAPLRHNMQHGFFAPRPVDTALFRPATQSSPVC